MKVLVVDDDAITREMLTHVLNADGYEVVTARDGEEALAVLRSGTCHLVVTDWQMPNMDGLELCRKIRAGGMNGYVYIILLTRRGEAQDVLAGLGAGADDYVTKPFEHAELTMRLRTGERILGLEMRDVMIFSLAKLTESRDADTGAHLERVRSYSRVIAEHLRTQPGFGDQVDGSYVELIYQTSPLHDIGKVAIPDSILLKAGRLTEAETAVMRTHTVHGAATLEAALDQYPSAEFLLMARDIAVAHHEWWDGTGYPYGLAGATIPLSGRIVALPDMYDALRTHRVYKAAMSHEKAKSIIAERIGTQFDPAIHEAFLATEDQFIAIHDRHRDDIEGIDDIQDVEAA